VIFSGGDQNAYSTRVGGQQIGEEAAQHERIGQDARALLGGDFPQRRRSLVGMLKRQNRHLIAFLPADAA
jgi:hypothetical protein